jgi:N-acetylmuramic acid 6-phosphate (MurNAc-6-P) etherase
MPFHRIVRHRVLATGVAPSAAGDDLTACDADVNHAFVMLNGLADTAPTKAAVRQATDMLRSALHK